MLDFFGVVVKDGLPYKHNSPEFSDCDRRNAASHLRSLLLGQSVLVPVVEGKPVLGQFQSVMLAEFDGPRQRALHIQVLGE
jgi:secondary thiamine-phosphate synthase enzyme